MSMADDYQEALLENFISVAGVDRERATFYLQSAGWDIQAAFGAFYDDGPSPSGEQSVPVQESQQPSRRVESSDSPPLQPHQAPVKPRSEQGGVATLSDYRDKNQPKSDEDAQQFYAGGSEHSGQMIEGPPRKKPTPESLAQDVFEAAKKQGAVAVEEEERELARQKEAAFQGTGFKLGDSEGPSVAIGNKAAPKQEKVRHTLTFWHNGFSVDDGPLRTGETDEDKRFIASVSKGEIPQELIRAARGGEVDIDIQDKRTEPYVKPKPKVVAFSGEGRKLGGLAPEVLSHQEPATSSGASQGAASTPTVPLDPSQPTTSVQIRLADGTRLVSKFNHTHTVNDVRQFINLVDLTPTSATSSSRPSLSTAGYILMTTFPNKELTDPTQTLADAKLLNAVIVQRMTP